MIEMEPVSQTQEVNASIDGRVPSPISVAGGGQGRAARSRAMVYSILAQAVSSPSEALCVAVEDGSFCALLGYALAGTPAPHRRAIEPGLPEKFAVGTVKGSLANPLLLEYTRLFASNLHCPQYEADYLASNADNSVHVMARVVNMYSTFGVRLADGAGERPDHIAVELDFMNFLAAKEAHAKDKSQGANARLCRRAQALFFGAHLSRWGLTFARNLGEATSLSFYQGTRELLEIFLLAEAKYLKVNLGAPAVEQGGDDVPQRRGRAGTANEQQNELISITGHNKAGLHESS